MQCFEDQRLNMFRNVITQPRWPENDMDNQPSQTSDSVGDEQKKLLSAVNRLVEQVDVWSLRGRKKLACEAGKRPGAAWLAMQSAQAPVDTSGFPKRHRCPDRQSCIKRRPALVHPDSCFRMRRAVWWGDWCRRETVGNWHVNWFPLRSIE